MATAQRRKRPDIDVRIQHNRELAAELDRRGRMTMAKADRRAKPHELPAELAELPDSFESPESSIVASANYDEGTRLLMVALRKGPNVTKEYTYDGFPLMEWAEFVTAPSKGQYFSERIRPRYKGRPLAS